MADLLTKLRRHHRARLLGFSLTAIAITALTFVAFRELAAGPTADAEPAIQREPLWYQAEQERDDGIERFDGTILGIRIGPAVDGRESLITCSGNYQQTTDVPDVGAILSPLPSYIPPDTERIETSAVLCLGEVVSAEARYSMKADRSAGRLGGQLQIYRFKGTREFRFDAAANRVNEMTIGNTQAVVVEPITVEGYGRSAVFISEPWGLTTIRASGITISELLRIAESLLPAGGTR